MRSLRGAVALALVLSLVLPSAALSDPGPDAGTPDASGASDASTVADDILHFATQAHITTITGHVYPISPGYYVPAGKWGALDLELKRLQAAEVRLGAENKSLRVTNADHPWKLIKLACYSIGAGIVIGAVGLWYVRR